MGKSSFLMRLCKNEFRGNTSATLGIVGVLLKILKLMSLLFCSEVGEKLTFVIAC